MFGINKTPIEQSIEARAKHVATCTARRNGKVVERLEGSAWVGTTYPSINAAKRVVRASGLKSYTV